MAVVAAAVSVELGGVLVALGLLAHGAWDAVLWRARRVLSPSFTEWCAVFDVVVGIGIVVLVR